MKTYSEFIVEARRRSGSHIDLSPLGKAVIKGTAKLAWKATKAVTKAAGKAVRDYGKTKPEGTKRRAVADILDKIAPKISPTVRKKRERQARKTEQEKRRTEQERRRSEAQAARETRQSEAQARREASAQRASSREARAAAREERAAARERRAQETHERRMQTPQRSRTSSRRPRTSSSPSGKYRNVGAGRRESVSGNG
jgi:hypothetical protein